ncbi:MAG: TetR/AcrR family transcriptional regulator [Comamonadaceae bacterium]|nr:MAG: TetR/AcrR family transcriptional regulator [Comamonadaceae bacterium]
MALEPSRKQVTHDRILDTAARALRASGFAGVGVADVMQQAGLTHGGFYAHFGSRDELLAEALEQAGRHSRERLQRGVAAGEAQGMSRFRALVESYLADRHLQSPESGCPVAALASEMPRQVPQVREAGAGRVRSLLAFVDEALGADHPPDTAGLVAAQLVGTLQLARALGDTAAGRAMLAAAREALVAQYDTPAAGA